MTPIKLYHRALQDRSDRVRWLLEELSVPYEDIKLNRSKGEDRSREYLNLNPMARVPTIVDGEEVLFESGAICLYLADKYSREGHRLAPAHNSAERGKYLQWMVFSVASLECVVAKMFALQGLNESQKTDVLNFIQEQCAILKVPINRQLENQSYFLKSGFSAADIMMAAVIPGASEYLIDAGSPLERYMSMMKERPAALKVKVFE